MELTALNIFGLFCLILFCFGPVTYLIVELYQKKPRPKRKDGTRIPADQLITYWDYLVIILPTWLILIGLFSNNQAEKAESFSIVGFGYMMLILSNYYQRMDKIRFLFYVIFIGCLLTAVIGYLLQQSSTDYDIGNHLNASRILFCPLVTFMYVFGAKAIIKRLAGSPPIAVPLDKQNHIGEEYPRYNRRINYWDATWTLINVIVVPLLILILVN